MWDSCSSSYTWRVKPLPLNPAALAIIDTMIATRKTEYMFANSKTCKPYINESWRRIRVRWDLGLLGDCVHRGGKSKGFQTTDRSASATFPSDCGRGRFSRFFRALITKLCFVSCKATTVDGQSKGFLTSAYEAYSEH